MSYEYKYNALKGAMNQLHDGTTGKPEFDNEVRNIVQQIDAYKLEPKEPPMAEKLANEANARNASSNLWGK